MIDFTAVLRKEWMEALRTKKLLVLGLVLVFFAVSDPIMLKLTPALLEEFSGADMSAFIELTQPSEMMDFHQDITLIFTIVLVMITANIWGNEVKHRTLVIPLTKGLDRHQLLLAKGLIYGLGTLVLVVIAYGINYWYSGLLFGYRMGLAPVLRSAVMTGFYYLWLIFFMMAMNTIIYNGSVVAFTGLMASFGGPFLMQLVELSRFTPFGLLAEAGLFAAVIGKGIVATGLWSMFFTFFGYGIGCLLADRKELIGYR